MALFDPYGRTYEKGQTVVWAHQQPQLDGIVEEVSALVTKSRQYPGKLVRRVTVLSTFIFEIPQEAPPVLPVIIVKQPEKPAIQLSDAEMPGEAAREVEAVPEVPSEAAGKPQLVEP